MPVPQWTPPVPNTAFWAEQTQFRGHSLQVSPPQAVALPHRVHDCTTNCATGHRWARSVHRLSHLAPDS